MVAVPHHEQEPVADQSFKSIEHGLYVRDKVAADMSAAHIQFKIVQRFAAMRARRSDHCILHIFVQQQNVRELEIGRLADLQSGRNALEYGRLRGADERCTLPFERIRLEVDRQHDPRTHGRKRRLPLHQYEAGRQRAENPTRAIGTHLFRNARDTGRTVCVFKIDLRQCQAQGRRFIPYECIQRVPVSAVRGVLVAGDDRPCSHIDMRLRQ